jgi:hypothetical protein
MLPLLRDINIKPTSARAGQQWDWPLTAQQAWLTTALHSYQDQHIG